MNPVNVQQYDQSIDTASDPVVRENLLTMKGIASAYWIDRKDKIRGNDTRNVEGILADAAAKSPPELVVLIWYDFPNRDCAAAASMGEICCAYLPNGRCDWGNGSDCAAGLNEYKTTYVDPFIEVLVEYKGRVTSPWVRCVLGNPTARQSPIGMATVLMAETGQMPAAKILVIFSVNGIQEMVSKIMHRCCAGLPRESWAWMRTSSSTRGAMECLVRALTRRIGATFATQEQAMSPQQMFLRRRSWMPFST